MYQKSNFNIFSQFGIGTDKQAYERNRHIFKNKIQSNPDILCPRNFDQHYFPEEFFMEFQVQQRNNSLKLCTYRYPQYHNIINKKNEKPKGLIYMFHGMHGHTNQAAHIAESLSQLGYCVMGFDHRGSGKSQGIKGYVGSIEDHLEDSHRFLEITSEEYDPNLPKFVMGLSMGGMTTYLISHLKKNFFKGSIMFAPALLPIHNNIDQKLAHFLAQIIPSMPFLPPNIYASNRIKEVCEELANEEFNQRGIFAKPGTISSIFKGMEMCNQSFQEYSTPFLIVQGGIDKLVDPLGPKLLLEKAPVSDKKLIWYDNMWHDIYHEPEIEEIIPQVAEWVQERT